MQRHIIHKAGASNSARPAVCPSGLSTGRTGTGQDHDRRAKLRAPVDVLGPCFVRFDDGRSAILSAEALKIVPFHERLQ